MATLLRKLCESASLKRSGSNLNSNPKPNSSSENAPSPLGAFDSLPPDIFMQIVRLLGPKDAAKLTLLSKSWRSLVSDNALWVHFLQTHHPHSAFFAETVLSFGYPLPTCFDSSSTMIKIAGPWLLRTLHVSRFNMFMPCVNDSLLLLSSMGVLAIANSGGAKKRLPRGDLQLFWMQVKPSSQPVVVSIPICHYDDTESAKASRQQLKEAIYAALFDMNVPAICALNQGTLALYAAKQTSGIAINIGFQVTSIVPILNGKVMRKVGVEVVGLGALKLTGFLREQMQQNNISFESLYTVRTLKEKLCYVAVDYEAELLKDTQASFEAVEGLFTLSRERFQTGEILFQPHLAGVRAMGLQQAIALCMDHCYSAELAGNDDWYKTVVLSGGTACLPGLAERLEKELHSLLPPYMSNGIRVIPPPYGVDTAWFGGRIIGSLSTFPGPWCTTKKQFRQKSKLSRIW